MLARKHAVLYLNLEEYAGFEELLGKTFSYNLGDLLYYVHEEHPNLMLKLSAMVQTINQMDYIPPVQAPCDIRAASWEDWEKLLQEIVQHSAYEIVILDVGSGIEETFQLLDLCKKIYMPVLSDAMSVCKITQFENLLRLWDFPQVLEKTEKIRLPLYAGSDQTQSYIEQLLWSELGDYVRKMLREEGE